MGELGIGLFTLLSYGLVCLYQATWQRPPKKQLIWQGLYFGVGLGVLFGLRLEIKDLVAILILHLLVSASLIHDLFFLEIDVRLISLFFSPAILYRILFWPTFGLGENISLLVSLGLGTLLFRFSRKFLARADWLLLLSALILLGAYESLTIFIISLVLTVVVGGLFYLFGKAHKNLELPYVPIYALGFWIWLGLGLY